jgi:hypothetical protein
MPLIDLKTNLKSLKYGNDRPGGGDSGQPYQKVDINTVDSGFNRFRMTKFDDGLVRGGIVGATNAAIIDTLRIGKFLTDLPKGPLWIAKQVGLQLSNPKLESKAPKTGIGLLDKLIINFNDKVGIGPTRLYNLGVNTLAQIPVNALGIHFNRHGILPVQDDTTKYLSVVRENNQNTGTNNAKITPNSTNRLLRYAAKLLPAAPPKSKPPGVINQLLSLIPGASLFIKPQQQTIDNYIGGPGSVYGIGRTIIKRYDYTSSGVNKQQPQEKGKVNYLDDLGVSKDYFISGYTGDGAEVKNNISNNGFTIPNNSAIIYTSNNAVGKYIELQNKITEQSSVTQRISNGLNQVNVFKTQNPNIDRGAIDFKYFRGNRTTNAFARTEQDQDNKLLAIKFIIIDPFDRGDKTLTFSAYIKGFRETFDGTWNETNYVGRSESFYTYNKFKRGASFNLDIPCFNQTELISKHRDLETLLSTTAGSYSGNNFLGGVLIKIKLGNYLDDQYAIINNITYEVPDDSSWDVDKKLAMYIKATFNINIINKVLPQYNPKNTDDVFFNTK